MANQLYAAPIIIEAFQTGKAEMAAECEIQSAREPAPSPNNGPFTDFSRSSVVRLDKGIIQIDGANAQNTEFSAANIPEFPNFSSSLVIR
ncbi:hypothetical protein [Caballeronia sp. dw_19]|uniref:hypothetical protein n=1 Tax=unclassified Caballeronia TaxID=2646786 RepID=UPI001BD6DAFB|nr:hypothetical protein [Caballeronia sp. dw_19]